MSPTRKEWSQGKGEEREEKNGKRREEEGDDGRRGENERESRKKEMQVTFNNIMELNFSC